MSDTEDDDIHPRKWQWWRVSGGVWKEPELDWLTGSLPGMVEEYGGYHRLPMIEQDYADLSITVFSLTKFVGSEIIKQLSEYNAMSNEEQDEARNGWEEDSPIRWLWFFEHVYPSSHLVFVHYGLIEAHGIFCATYKDMLDVVQLVRSGAK
jgi:hypothetical protein